MTRKKNQDAPEVFTSEAPETEFSDAEQQPPQEADPVAPAPLPEGGHFQRLENEQADQKEKV